MKKTISELSKRDNELQEDIDLKMTIEEGQKIWANFSKFAVYDDLRDLYQRCVPEIAKFEDK